MRARGRALRSSADTELFSVLETVCREHFPGAPVVPSVLGGFPDSHFLRDLGITAYGFIPVVIPVEDEGTIHGNNERISVENAAGCDDDVGNRQTCRGEVGVHKRKVERPAVTAASLPVLAGPLRLVLHRSLPGDIGPDQFRVRRRQVALEAAHPQRRELAAEDCSPPQISVLQPR